MMNWMVLILILSLTFPETVSGHRYRSYSESDEVLYLFRYPTYYRYHPRILPFPFWPFFPRGGQQPAPGPPVTGPTAPPRGDSG
ncbi:hypothetical protein AGOR_G00191340 [Albula goreensis]|uniref:Secreted protein n=1 Tax=Albula goreensis TaxID=1534307 RepID=A0A8T3CYQ1_9TELE|nr:hypothetical protein AGOR_G00191340 [Albula goreensis]